MDIETLRFIWWLLIGILLIGFALTDGWDFGAAILFPFITKNDLERRIVLNVIGPFWEGNQVWIILGAGAIFAAWPYVYAVAFSGFYFLILLLLLTMGISRPVSFKYRSKLPNETWRRTWDRVVFIGGVFPALIFGILMGNALLGAPFYFDDTLRINYSGSFIDLFQPFAIWCGLTSLAMLTMHGGLYLAIKTTNPLRKRALTGSRFAALALILLFAIGGLWTAFLPGYYLTSGGDHFGYSNPLFKQVNTQVGMWLQNYRAYPWTLVAPTLGFLGAFNVLLTANWGKSKFAFVSSGLSLIGIIATVGVSMYPFMLPSVTHPNSSLIIWDASSSELTLMMMLGATIIFLPLIMLYTAWVFHALRGKVRAQVIEQDENHTAY